jgi:hypothetical protein
VSWCACPGHAREPDIECVVDLDDSGGKDDVTPVDKPECRQEAEKVPAVREKRSTKPVRFALPSVSDAALDGAKADGASSPELSSPSGVDSSPLSRKLSMNNVKRLITRQVSSTFSRMNSRMARRRTTIFTASKDLPGPAPPTRVPPLLVQHLPGVTIAGLRKAFESTENCPNTRFLREVLGATYITSSRWAQCPNFAGTQVRKISCMMPVPNETPEFIRRLLNIPESICSTTVWRLCSEGAGASGWSPSTRGWSPSAHDVQRLNIVQQSYTKDVMYGDRFKLQNILSFREAPEGVTLQQWAEVIWLKPLPWTHGMVKKFVEQRCISDITKMAPVHARIIEESAQSE